MVKGQRPGGLTAALYDIHGNLPALEAVLEEIRELGVERVIIGGDVLPGPMPAETLKRLVELDLPVQFLYGNGEVAVLEEMAGRVPAGVPEQYRPILRWTAEQVAGYEELLRGWPKTVNIEISGVGQVLFCHATPRNENEPFTRLTAEERLLPIFETVGAAMVVCGHTHMQFDRRVGKTRVVNAGSVGMPFGEAGADWLLLGRNVELRHTSYDLVKAAERIRATAYPQAAEFAERNVLNPPSEQQMLALFTRAEATPSASHSS